VPALGEVLQPLAEESVHAQAVVEDFGRRRVQADGVLPAAADVAVRGLDQFRVAVQAQEGGRVGFAGHRVEQRVAEPVFDGVGVARDDFQVEVEAVADRGDVAARLQVGRREQSVQALVVFGVQRHQPRETVDLLGFDGAGDDVRHGRIVHSAPLSQQD